MELEQRAREMLAVEYEAERAFGRAYSKVLRETSLEGLNETTSVALRAIAAALALAQPSPTEAETFQQRVDPWLIACFGEVIARDTQERNHRFIEEALELVQANGCTASEAHQLVDYVYGRPVGEPAQEAGGVMVTLAALCLASGLDMHECGDAELARVWTKVEKIRAKQAAKPKHSPLPQATAPTEAEIQRRMRDRCAEVARVCFRESWSTHGEGPDEDDITAAILAIPCEGEGK